MKYCTYAQVYICMYIVSTRQQQQLIKMLQIAEVNNKVEKRKI